MTELTLNVGMPEIAVMDAIADARLQGATGKNELYEKAAHYLTERMTCDLIITEHVRLAIIHFFVYLPCQLLY